ncbi:MAG: metallopeptidase family protein [Nakamurella sp.]
MAGSEQDPSRRVRASIAGRSSRPARPFLPKRPAPTAASPVPARRDRRGRGLRTPLLPTDVPASRTRAQRFDQAVLEAVADLEERWPGRLDAIEFAVDEVPAIPTDGSVLPSDEVVLDGGVPLTRFLPPGIDSRGRPTKARIVVYRRPLEVRSSDAGDLGELVAEVLGEQVSAVLGEAGDDGPVG